MSDISLSQLLEEVSILAIKLLMESQNVLIFIVK
jgi:hypothetical protein